MKMVLPESERERLLSKKITSSRAMELKERIKKVCRVKNGILFCLVLLFFLGVIRAVMTYWSQPLSTDITYKYGNPYLGVRYPQITLCHPNIYLKHPMFKDCRDEALEFITVISSCMKSSNTLEIADLIQNLHPEIGNIVKMVRFWTGSKYVSLWPLYKKVWTRVFLDVFGPCYTFDLSKVEDLKYLSLDNDGFGRPGIEFVMAEKNIWQTAELLLHTRFDLPDAYQLGGYVPLSFSDNINKALKVEIQKKITCRESTRTVPCVKYERRTCQSIENHRVIFEKFGCSVPILYSGQHLDSNDDNTYYCNSSSVQHLDNVIPKDVSNCSYYVTPEVLEFYVNQSFDVNKGSNCPMTQTCENVRFTSNYKVEDTWIENKTLIYVVFESPEVEYRISYINYGWISLVGAIGGILGLTLGASAFTLSEFLLKHVPYFFK